MPCAGRRARAVFPRLASRLLRRVFTGLDRLHGCAPGGPGRAQRFGYSVATRRVRRRPGCPAERRCPLASVALHARGSRRRAPRGTVRQGPVDGANWSVSGIDCTCLVPSRSWKVGAVLARCPWRRRRLGAVAPVGRSRRGPRGVKRHRAGHPSVGRRSDDADRRGGPACAASGRTARAPRRETSELRFAGPHLRGRSGVRPESYRAPRRRSRHGAFPQWLMGAPTPRTHIRRRGRRAPLLGPQA